MTKAILALAAGLVLLTVAAEAREAVASSADRGPGVIIRVDRPPYDESGSPLS